MIAAIRPAKCSALLHWGQWVLFLAGSFALVYSAYIQIDAKVYQAYENDRFQKELYAARAGLAKTTNSAALLPTISAKQSAPETQENPSVAPSAVSGAIGRLEIGRVGLAAMIVEGIDSGNLRRALGHIPETPLPGQMGNVGIAGHRDSFFRGLQSVQQNDEITIATLQGVYHYVVDFSEVVEPDHIAALESSGEPILTLVTCYPFYYVGPAPKRLIVRAHLTGVSGQSAPDKPFPAKGSTETAN